MDIGGMVDYSEFVRFGYCHGNLTVGGFGFVRFEYCCDVLVRWNKLQNSYTVMKLIP